MKHAFASRLLFSVVLLTLVSIPLLPAQESEINYDEAKIQKYTLPDPLRLADGKTVTSAKGWENGRRPQIIQLFETNVYGRLPGKPAGLHFKVTSVDSNALGGSAIRKLITIYFTKVETAPSMDVMLYLPKKATGPVPVFAELNFCGNHCTTADATVPLASSWIRNSDQDGAANNRATEQSRGSQSRRWPFARIIESGFGVATAYYGDLEPDHPEGWRQGIRTTLKSELKIQEAEWGAIGAWAWGYSRMMDYLESDPSVNAKQVIVKGHSRLGKAALWAGANDRRFAAVISNESGEGGAALARRWYGETIKRINTSFPHWFVARYKTYNDNVSAMPLDQHMLLALVAPRPLYVASAEEDRWADPKGEFLGAKGAEPVYALYRKKGLGVDQMPSINQPVGETIRYHIRTGKHDVTDYDWEQYLKFAGELVRGRSGE